jgi:hypothetical protein
VVYRRELRPVLTTGAEAMDRLFPKLIGPRTRYAEAAHHIWSPNVIIRPIAIARNRR